MEIEDAIKDTKHRVWLVRQSNQLQLEKKVTNELKKYVMNYLETNMVEERTMLEMNSGYTFIVLHPHYVPYSKTIRYLGDVHWIAKYLDVPGEDRQLEVSVSVGCAVPKYYKTFTKRFSLDECIHREMKWKFIPRAYINMDHILEYFKTDIEIKRHIDFVINQYTQKGDRKHDNYTR